MYCIQEQFLEDIINNNWMYPGSRLVLIGGIMINCDGKGSDRFLPLKFEIRTKDSSENLYEKTFGYTKYTMNNTTENK